MASDYFSKANEAFVEENYEQAVQLYTQAIEDDSSRDEYYVNRAHAFIKLTKYTDAVADCAKAIELDSQNFKAFLRKGISHFHLGEYELAKTHFTEGQKLNSTDSSLASWLQKCEEKLKDKPSPVTQVTNSANVQQKTEAATAQELPMPSGAKTRYDWYQTETHVIITILLKSIKKEDLWTDIQQNTLSCTVKMPTGSDYSLELDLAHPILPNQSQVKIMASKIEIKLKKSEGIRWAKLESDGQPASTVKQFTPASEDAGSAAHRYPSSCHYTRDWDKIVADIKQEEKDEKPEGDAALNSLFQQIYADGNDEVKKAMNKSFFESGGTVLSTNWNEIASKKTEVKPPDGMEYKKWDI